MCIFHAGVRDGDTATVRNMLSTACAQSLINYQDALGATPFYVAAVNGHPTVTEQLIETRCNINLQDKAGARRSTPRPGMVILPSQSSLLKLDVTWISSR